MPAKRSTKSKSRSLTKNQRKETRKIIHRCLKTRTEFKYFDASANSAMSDQWTFVQLVSPTQGDSDAGERVGDTIFPFKMEINATVVGADATNICRVVIYRVKTGQSSNTYFSLGSTAPNAYSPFSPYSHDRRDAIEVLMDKMLVTTSSGSNLIHLVRKNLKLAQKKIQFIGNSTVYELNGLYLAFCSDSGAVSHPGFKYNIRTFYTDS